MTSSLSINRHHIRADPFIVKHTHTHTGWHTSVRPCGYEFSSLFHFYSPVSSFSRLLHSLAPLSFSLLFLFQPYCFSSSLHRSLILFLIQAHCFYFCLFLSHINPLSHSCSVSLPQASCVYISVVYFYKCQTVFLPSVYWSTESERWAERSREKRGKGSEKERSRKKAIEKAQREVWTRKSSREKAGMRWQKYRKKQYKKW